VALDVPSADSMVYILQALSEAETMSKRAYLSTRKGLFELDHDGVAWRIGASHFLGEPVSFTLAEEPRRDGALYAALNLGHFGVKLHRLDAGGSWTEIAAPAYPLKPADSADPVEWKNKLIWAIAAGGADQPGVLWAGTLPGGLFRSNDRGDSWQLVQALWNVPQRAEWFGGGYDVPASTVCVDPATTAVPWRFLRRGLAVPMAGTPGLAARHARRLHAARARR
jgi:hypothetical protein